MNGPNMHTFKRNLGGVQYDITGELTQSSEGAAFRRITMTNTETQKVHELRDIELPHSGETAQFMCEALAQNQAEILLDLSASGAIRR
jgi:hypothetical protein